MSFTVPFTQLIADSARATSLSSTVINALTDKAKKMNEAKFKLVLSWKSVFDSRDERAERLMVNVTYMEKTHIYFQAEKRKLSANKNKSNAVLDAMTARTLPAVLAAVQNYEDSESTDDTLAVLKHAFNIATAFLRTGHSRTGFDALNIFARRSRVYTQIPAKQAVLKDLYRLVDSLHASVDVRHSAVRLKRRHIESPHGKANISNRDERISAVKNSTLKNRQHAKDLFGLVASYYYLATGKPLSDDILKCSRMGSVASRDLYRGALIAALEEAYRIQTDTIFNTILSLEHQAAFRRHIVARTLAGKNIKKPTAA